MAYKPDAEGNLCPDTSLLPNKLDSTSSKKGVLLSRKLNKPAEGRNKTKI